MGEDPSLR
jgi:hypothetical protein